jgi:hypothetical protein
MSNKLRKDERRGEVPDKKDKGPDADLTSTTNTALKP